MVCVAATITISDVLSMLYMCSHIEQRPMREVGKWKSCDFNAFLLLVVLWFDIGTSPHPVNYPQPYEIPGS